MNDAELKAALRKLLEEGQEGARRLSVASPPEERIPWLVAEDAGYITSLGYTTDLGRDKLQELRSPFPYWLKGNAVTIINTALALAAIIIAALALVIAD